MTVPEFGFRLAPMVGRVVEVQPEGRWARLMVTLDGGGIWSHRIARWTRYVFPLDWTPD